MRVGAERARIGREDEGVARERCLGEEAGEGIGDRRGGEWERGRGVEGEVEVRGGGR